MNQKELQNNIIQAVKEVQIKEQDEDIKRDFFGKKGDEFFFTAIDPEGRLSILDAEDNEVLGSEDVDIDVDSENKEKDFLIAAAQNIDIDTISFPLVTKFNLLGLEKKEDEPEEEKEPEEEVEPKEDKEVKPEEDKEVKPEEEIEEVPESKEDKEKNTNFGDLRKEVQSMVEQDKEDIIREVTEFILKPEVFKTKQEAIEHIQEFSKERVTEIFLNPGGEGFRVAVLEVIQPESIKSIWDNGGDTIDRFTVVFKDNSGLSLSVNPGSPQGVSQFSNEVEEGSNLGKKIGWNELPENVRENIVSRVSEGKVPDDLRDKLGDKIKKLKEDVKVFRTSGEIFKTREEAEEFVKTSTKGGVLINVPDKGFQVGFKELNIRSEDTIEVEPELDRKEKNSSENKIREDNIRLEDFKRLAREMFEKDFTELNQDEIEKVSFRVRELDREEKSSAERDSNESIKGDLKKYKEDIKKATKKVKDLEGKLKKEKVKENIEIKEDTESDLEKFKKDLEKAKDSVKSLELGIEQTKKKLKQEKDDKKNESIIERDEEFVVVAKGLDTKEFAEKVAKDRDEGKVIQDSDDPNKFAVVVMKERQDGTKVIARDLKTKEDAEVVARSKPRTKVIKDPQDKTKYSVIQTKDTKESIEDLLKKHNIK